MIFAMNEYKKILDEIYESRDDNKAKNLQWFFKTKPGQYGHGDKFLGLVVPKSRLIVKKYAKSCSFSDIEKLIKNQWHEVRLISLLLLIEKFKKANTQEKEQFFRFYLANTEFINNWDLVDLSAPNIVGTYLLEKMSIEESTILLSSLAKSDNLWEKRIGIISTFAFIKNGEPIITLDIAKILLNDKEDLIQKATGWMLRELGKRCDQILLESFLQKDNLYKAMPRTMLRYAIEKFPEELRQKYLKGTI